MATYMGAEFQQNWDDLFIWEKFFNDHCPRTFIELGTGRGGMSLFTASQCRSRGIQYHTFDNNTWIDLNGALASLLNIRGSFHLIDIFSDEGINQIAALIDNSPHPLAMFFDDGNKPREWSIFAPKLSSTGRHLRCSGASDVRKKRTFTHSASFYGKFAPENGLFVAN